MVEGEPRYEYIVVGSGAGGGTVAANLARAGRKVLLLEAGGDPGEGQDPPLYRVPVFHSFSTEDPSMRWDFFVRHYADDEKQRRDPKFVDEFDGRRHDGIYYPRAGTLGGCTAHNGMIFVYPHNRDWDDMADLTGDPSWQSGNMRKYFQALEACRYRPLHKWLRFLGLDRTRHGYGGWLSTQLAVPLSELIRDEELVRIVLGSASEVFEELHPGLGKIRRNLKTLGEPNDWRWVIRNAEGIRMTPLTTDNHTRIGTREYLRQVARDFPDLLTIQTDSLVSRVLFEGKTATGVEYFKGEKLYLADRSPQERREGTRKRAYVTGEVILAGGAFNTPQILMLSGVGPEEELKKHGIPVLADSPGVGRNLQDRYEVGIVNRMKKDWDVLEGAKFLTGDKHYRKWEREREGVYITNGAVLAVVKRSRPERPLPDLFCFALLGKFPGYFPNYSELARQGNNYLTWVVLKAHTNNRGGRVTLRSADPRDPPHVNFHYFEEGTDQSGEDLDSVVEGIRFVRELTGRVEKYIEDEELPGRDLSDRRGLRQFVRDHAWGHHASCSCKIGKDDDRWAVLDGNFRVRGVQNLRVVDASVFPKIPGFFIVSSVYMIGMKASDAILADAK